MLKYAAEKLKASGYNISYPDHYSVEQGYMLEFFSRLYWREAAAKPEE